MENLQQNTNSYSIEDLRGLMATLIRSQQETDKRFQDTEKLLSSKFQETQEQFKEIQKELGGIGKSNGAIAEDFFGSALENSMTVGKLSFDYIDFNTRRKRNNTEAEYDIILYNHYKVLVIEVKYNFRKDQLRTFYDGRLKKFKTLFPEYKDYKLYGGVAALAYEKDVIEEAKRYGFFVLTQNNDKLKLANEIDFIPNEIK